MRTIVALALLVPILLLAGCGGAKAPPAAPPPVSSPQVSSPSQPTQQTPAAAPAVEGFYPSDTRTGIAAVDGVIEAVVSGNSQALSERHQPVTLPCLKREWQGAPLCPADKPAGTPVTAYPYAWCNLAFHAEPRELATYVAAAVRGGKHLFAVYKPTRIPGLDQTSAAYAAVFGTGLEDPSAPTLYLDTNGQILLVRWGCGMPDLAVPAGADLVLAPKATATEAKRRDAEAGLASVVEGEVGQMHTFLRAVLGEYDPCAGATKGCIMDTALPSVVEGLITRCEKVGPEAQMSGYAYNEQRHGPVFRPYKAACDTLLNARHSLGEPADTPAWREQVLRVRQLLDPAIKATGGPGAK